MIYEMNLHDDPFNKIKNGTKTIEMRLNDEKRKLLKIDDIIIFNNRLNNEKIKTKIVKIYKYNNFEELFNHFEQEKLGYKKNEKVNFKDMELYYSKEDQKKYGVLAIEIKLLKNC